MEELIIQPVPAQLNGSSEPVLCGSVKADPCKKVQIVVKDFEDLIKQIYSAFAADEVDVESVTAIMEAYKSIPSEWKKFAKFDRYKYTRNLVDAGNGRFNLMLLCWGPSQQSCIHDHTDAHCFLKVLSGSLQETRYSWPKKDEAMQPCGSAVLYENEVAYINDSLGLHRVSNTSDSEGAISLHLYCPPFNHCQAFDERTGQKLKCPVTFYSKFGKKVDYRKE